MFALQIQARKELKTKELDRVETRMIETQAVETRIKQFIFEKFPVAAGRQLGADTLLLETGIVDSIGILEIVAFLEENFAVRVEDDDLAPENFGSIAGIAAFVGRKLSETPMGKES